ncbi:unnamed protein product [Periconia digitata]|uniref:Uncharacterized protein n=1 Tax=Periconia digitata TaxID=1303443 RepID=A0A9W4UG20_9PLEO|nr:unnamed protein product [Periconia digitata]
MGKRWVCRRIHSDSIFVLRYHLVPKKKQENHPPSHLPNLLSTTFLPILPSPFPTSTRPRSIRSRLPPPPRLINIIKIHHHR